MNKQREEIIKYMATNGIYPFISKKGKVFLKSQKIYLDNIQKIKLLKLLNITDKDSCCKVRKEIKDAAKLLKKNVPIKEWVLNERPREMLIKNGAESLSVSKLLAIILRTGKEGISAEELAKRVLNKFRTLRDIDNAPISDICAIEGIGMAKASQIKAAFELGKRLLKEKAEKKIRIKEPSDAISYVMDYYGPYLRDAKKEFFCIVLLDIKNQPICNMELSKGTINASIVDIKDVIKEAIIRSASAIILVHNHPSGDPSPSNNDINITKKIIKGCAILDIKVLDHIIIGKNRNDFFSFNAHGLI